MTLRRLRVLFALVLATLLVPSSETDAHADESAHVFILPRQGVALDLGIRTGAFRGIFLLAGSIGPTRRAEADLGYDPRPFGGLDPARFQNASFFPRLTASIGAFF